MSENVVVSILCKDAEIARLRGIPSAIQLLNFELTASKDKSERVLVSPVPGVTLDANVVHRDSQRRSRSTGKRTIYLNAANFQHINAKWQLLP
jgi:hypothetical protein